jgi:hypothetical protein
MLAPITISAGLREKLVVLRASQLRRLREGADAEQIRFVRHWYEELQSIDGVHLWGTIGADVYLTFDGRFILSEDRIARGQFIRETNELGYIGLGLATAAFVFDLPELLAYLPDRPNGEPPCPCCQGARQVVYASGGHPPKQTCPYCCGLGWGKQILE